MELRIFGMFVRMVAQLDACFRKDIGFGQVIKRPERRNVACRAELTAQMNEQIGFGASVIQGYCANAPSGNAECLSQPFADRDRK